ncbi:MAG: RDD family protein [Gammaproteobacteria bacterium]|nr:RDD family protein [Gammaproteobacteria bacterium]
MDVEEYASFGQRALASIIDSIIFGVLSAVILLLLFGDSGVQLVSHNGQIQFVSSKNWTEQLFYIVVTIFMWMKFTGTPGKLLMGCHVVDADTKQPLTLRQSIIRYFGYFVSLLPLGLGFFWVIWDKRNQGFHDKLANTIVITDQPLWGGDDESQKTLEQLIEESK